MTVRLAAADLAGLDWLDDGTRTGLEVRPGHRGRGVGGALLAESHRLLADGGHAAVELSVDDRNHRAAALYRRLGYVVTGAGADAGLAGPEPWTLMRLELAAGQTRRKR